MRIPIAALIALLCAPLAASAQDISRGQEVFEHFCAACHGIDARGKGPMEPIMLLKPANLRRLAALNDGTFPTARVITRIDGRNPLVAHGSKMPVYGTVFRGKDTEVETETGQFVATSRTIADLVAYLEGLQE